MALILQLPPRATESSLPSPSGPTAAFTMEEVKTPGAMEVRTAVATGSTRAVPRGWRKVWPPVSRRDQPHRQMQHAREREGQLAHDASDAAAG